MIVVNQREQKREAVQAIVDRTRCRQSGWRPTDDPGWPEVIGNKPHKRYWQAVDQSLAKHGVQMQNGDRGRAHLLAKQTELI